MTRHNIGQAKEKGIRVEEEVKTDLALLKTLLPHEMWGRKIESDGDVVRVLVRMYKEKKIGAMEVTPSESETNFSINGQEFKDLEWRAKRAEDLLEVSQKRFIYLCNLTQTDPKVIYEKFARR